MMANNHINELIATDELFQLIQKENFVGWVFSLDYDNALVVTNDAWKYAVKGIPHNAFLLASTFTPDNYADVDEMDREVVLLRVMGTCKLPQDDDAIKTKLDSYQNLTELYPTQGREDFDAITKNKLQFGGLTCRVLGTFYMKNSELHLGSDIETFSVSMRMGVYFPKGEALETIVNYVDPIRKKRAKEEFKALGITADVPPFKIGTVRYTSTDRLHRAKEVDKVPFRIQPSDFLSRRTAVLGMTRTGKSNMIKQTISVVKNISDRCALPIGQLIYDLNGEYANANQQDSGSIAEIYSEECVRYRMVPATGFRPILNNFYEQIADGYVTICETTNENPNSSAVDIKTFLNMSFDEPDEQDRSLHYKWQVRVAIYKALLYTAGFDCSSNYKISFPTNADVRKVVDESVSSTNNLTLEQAKEWFLKAREHRKELFSSNGKLWLEDDCVSMLNMIACKNSDDRYFNGYKVLLGAKMYHTKDRTIDVSNEIYGHLCNGKIVILDLSVGNAALRDKLSKKIAAYIFNSSMDCFTRGETPPNIVLYIEEAHNLIGKENKLTDTWPRIAKEGAKYRISLVYATQEVSSVHPNILANTENWIVSHINSEREVRELAKFYDFSDFSKSLLRSQDVGFSRVKTLSSPFVVPIQIDKFDPERIKRERTSQ